MRLSEHFHLDEFTDSQAAARKGLDNAPPEKVLAVLKDTAMRLERVRTLLGRPILISSGYRSPAVNRAVGGVPSSAHVLGCAVDFICPGFGSPLNICVAIQASDIEFDQVIEEYGRWVHISFDGRMRRQVLTKSGAGYRQGIAA